MKAIDTNVLVRFLVKDDEAQANLVQKKFKEAEEGRKSFYVPLLVLLETIWVLESVYEIQRNALVDAINDLTLMPVIEFEAMPAIQSFIFSAKKTTADLPDLLIGHSARHSGCEIVLTFDKKASKTKLFEILK